VYVYSHLEHLLQLYSIHYMQEQCSNNEQLDCVSTRHFFNSCWLSTAQRRLTC